MVTALYIAAGALIMVAIIRVIMFMLLKDSQYERIQKQYPMTNAVMSKMTPFQSGAINGTSFNGTLSIGITESHLLIRPSWPMPSRGGCAIPIQNIVHTGKKSFTRFEQFDLPEINATIGLEFHWIRKIKTLQQVACEVREPRGGSRDPQP